MKLTIALLIAAFLQVHAEGYSQQINLSQKNAQLEDVFKQIMNQTDYHFLYYSQALKDAKPVDIELINASLADALEQCFKGQPLTYILDNNTVIVKALPPPVKGKVTNSKGESLPGVTVVIKGTNKGTITDANGNYSLEVLENENVLVFSFVGMEKKEEIIGGRIQINVVLEESISQLNEVIVVGYGTTKKKDLTGSVGSVTSKDIQQIKAQTIDQTMVGKVAGVYVQNRGGQPGAGAFVQIRGLSQIRGDNQPLYVIDGVAIVTTPNSESLGLINYGSRENPLLSINPEDIERMDILKDASAAAIYGSRAANGVVIITTKRGKRDQAPRFSFNASTTTQNPVNKYDYLSAPEYIKWAQKNAQVVLDKYPPQYWSYFPIEYAMVTDPENAFGKANTDWQNIITNKNAIWNQISFNVSGGSDKINYFTSLGVSDQDGVMIDNNFKRYNFSSNLDANISAIFKVGTSVNYNYSINNQKGFNSLSQGAFRPDLEAYNEDGSYATYVGDYGEQYTLLGDGNQTRSTGISSNLLGTVYGEVKILNGLKFRSQISVGLNDDKTNKFSTSKSSSALFYGLYYSKPGATLGVQTNNGLSTNFTNTLSYNKTIKEDHTIDAVLGVSWDKNRYNAEAQSYRGFPDDDVLVDINSASFFDDAQSESLEQGLNSVFGRINYNYKDKYLATFTARRDGSTKFGPDNQYGFFPSGALAWNMQNENFLKDNPVINQLKLRASMGKVGSDNLPSFTYLAYYQALENNDSYYDGQNGIAVTGVPNTGIRWEETNQLDLGVEFGLFHSRLNGEIVYYKKNTDGIILFYPIPSETGAYSWNTNIADVSNKGWEFTIGSDIIRKENFTWNTSLNISTVKNNVDKLNGSNPGSQTGIIEGEPIGVITGYTVIKIAQTQGEIDALNESVGGLYQSSLKQPGDYIFKDITGDDKITTADRGPIGNPNPDFFGGWNNQLSYKNWNFNMNWNFAQGVERLYGSIVDLYSVNVQSNITSLALDTWATDNTDASYARLGSPTNGYTPTSRAVVDGSYIKLRVASIGYNLPKKWVGNFGVSNAQLTVSGNNLITITNYPGLDPEDVISSGFAGRSTNFNQDDGRSYPNTRSFTFSLNITF